MYVWFLVSMWIHLLAAITWIGGLAFIAMVLAPTLRRPELKPQAVLLLRVSGAKFMRIAYATLVTLVVTGTTNLFLKAGGSWDNVAALWPTTYGKLLEAKITLVLVVIALALRRRASWIGRVNTLLSLVIMTLALLLVRGLPV